MSRRAPRPRRASETPRASVASVAKRRASRGGENRARASSVDKPKSPSTIRDPRTARSRAPRGCRRPPRARQRRSTVSPEHGEGLRARDEVKGALHPLSGAREACRARHEKCTAASIKKPKSRYLRSRSANRAALRAERATSTSRRAASARNGVLTCRSASFGRRACRERRVCFASPSRRGVVARRKRIGRLNPRPTVRGDASRKTVFAKNARSATARCYAPNERHRPRDAQLQRAIVSLDVNRGRVTVAHVRAGVSTRHRRLEEERPH